MWIFCRLDHSKYIYAHTYNYSNMILIIKIYKIYNIYKIRNQK